MVQGAIFDGGKGKLPPRRLMHDAGWHEECSMKEPGSEGRVQAGRVQAEVPGLKPGGARWLNYSYRVGGGGTPLRFRKFET